MPSSNNRKPAGEQGLKYEQEAITKDLQRITIIAAQTKMQKTKKSMVEEEGCTEKGCHETFKVGS